MNSCVEWFGTNFLFFVFCKRIFLIFIYNWTSFEKAKSLNKVISNQIGTDIISSYKRASNIIEKENKGINGKPDPVLFRTVEEKLLYEQINEIRKAFTVKDDNKDYESLLIKLSDTKESTDNFFDNVVVNDENQDIKNNRLELLKMFCNTFDNFIDFFELLICLISVISQISLIPLISIIPLLTPMSLISLIPLISRISLISWNSRNSEKSLLLTFFKEFLFAEE